MPGEVFRGPRRAMPRKVDGRRADNPLRVAEPPLDQAGIRRRTGMNCQIECSCYEIADLIRHDQLDRHLGIDLHVLTHHWGDDTRQRHIGIQPQTAARGLLKRSRQILDLSNFCQDPATSLIELGALVSEAHLSCGPI